MRLNMGRLLPAVGSLVVASAMMPGALAQCGLPNKPIKPANWHSQTGSPQMMLVGDGAVTAPIVGMWHAVFTAHAMNGSPIPDTPIDNALLIFNSDGTEVMNSGRPPQDGNFCLGVWEQTGKSTYIVNHIPWAANDTTNAPTGIGNPTAGDQLLEAITLSPDGKSYSGSFKLDAYNTSGQLVVSFTGVLTASRITVTTPFSKLL
jgi:hypothetical protein